MNKSIRVDEDTHAALAALKGDDETFDEAVDYVVDHPDKRAIAPPLVLFEVYRGAPVIA